MIQLNRIHIYINISSKNLIASKILQYTGSLFENVIVELYKIKPVTFSFIKGSQKSLFTPSKRVQK